MPAPARMFRLSAPSAGVGASTSTRSSTRGCRFLIIAVCLAERNPYVSRDSGQNAFEFTQRFSDRYAGGTELEFANRALVLAGSLLDHRDRLSHLAGRFEESRENYCVGQITRIHRRFH